MTINLQKPDIRELKPKITVFGVGGGGGNAVNNMINGGLQGCEFVVANTDSQALMMSKAERVIQLGIDVTQGLGAGSQPDVGRAAAEECMDEIADHLQGTHMAFVTAGMGGGTGTGAAPVVARVARDMGILTVGVVTKPFHFEGGRRMQTADSGIGELQKNVDTLIVIPNQNLFRIANDKTTFADAFGMADQVLYSGVACITDLMVKEGLINLDFADVRSVMREMGKAMMGTGEASGDGRAIQAAESAIANPLLDETSMSGAQGLLISITGGRDLTLFEVDEAATRIREEVDAEANIILGATFDESLEGIIRVSVVATGIERAQHAGFSDNEENRAGAISQQSAAKQSPVKAIFEDAEVAELASAPKAPAVPVSLATPKPAQMQSESTNGKTEEGSKDVQSAKPQENVPAARIERDGVGITPLKPAQDVAEASADDEFKAALEQELMPEAEAFVPPAAEVPEKQVANSRIPDVEDFPPMVKAEIEQRSAEKSTASEERGPMSLLKKLTNGFSGKEESGETSKDENPAVSPPVQVENSAAAPQVSEVDSSLAPPQPARSNTGRVDNNPYAPKRSGLDANGRIDSSERPVQEDEQLDIPAFLRRQSS
ncbi:MAG: cell division protein FtsZ [Rhizobiaceae bacterium]